MRATGYYWIKFPYKLYGGLGHMDEHWEVGSWDAKAKVWLLVGSSDPWLEGQVKVGEKIEGPKEET